MYGTPVFGQDGSPPRVRGAVVINVSSEQSMRITPACAGSRNVYTIVGLRKTDHPRVCGEQYTFCDI